MLVDCSKEVTDINRDFLKQIMTEETTACQYPSPFDSSVDVRMRGDSHG